jgi:RimJ/RimL family protein N-acetyltransferase
MPRIAPVGPVVVEAQGLVLREWRASDVPTMVALFDTAEMDRWTPLASPFDEAVAQEYVDHAHAAREGGTVQLAITPDGGAALGEVLLFPTEHEQVCELAYAVGAAHRGRSLGVRAVLAVLGLARQLGYERARLRVAVDNVASRRVAEAAGFSRTSEPLVRRERKGYVLDLGTWERRLHGARDCSLP